jgi:hypothetical protein
VILRLAWKTLASHPIRAAVLGLGFGLGVGVMATLLGVGEVVLDQARAPVLAGGGDLIVTGVGGGVSSARFVLGALRLRSGRTAVASPRKRADLFLVRKDGKVVPVRARAGVPSLERAIGDPETSQVAAWTDTPADARWASIDHADVLRAMDRFHPLPDVPSRAGSWAEWLYFKGPSFYCTFLVGPRQPDGRRTAGVRLQLDRGGVITTASAVDALDEPALLASAPDITIGKNSVRLEGLRYRVMLDLPGVSGEFFIDAVPGRSLAPIEIRGAGGWVSGYTVPVMAGTLSGRLTVGGADPVEIVLQGAAYHDHNWGFWEGVSWRWGQVQHEGLSYVYGRVFPPADAADPSRVPGFLIALGPDGPIGYTTRVTIDETDDPSTGQPRRIVVTGRGGTLDLTFDIAVESAIVNKGGALAAGPDFLQLRARYRVTGRAGGTDVDFEAPGAAETFRGRE